MRRHAHFLGKASWDVKNIAGAIEVATGAGVTLAVLGGRRLSVSRGFRLTLSPRARFYGMVGGSRKAALLNQSHGHIFPVRWDEPFGLAMIESLYFGCPVFGTPYDSVREIVHPDVGFLSSSRRDLAEAIRSRQFDARRCHDYVRDTYTAAIMTDAYLAEYQTILAGRTLHEVRPFVGGRSKALLPWLP